MLQFVPLPSNRRSTSSAAHRLRRIASVACGATLAFIALNSDRADSRGLHQISDSSKRIELTNEDLFTHAGWNSLKISVAGFHLDMNRKDAENLAKTKGFLLADNIGAPSCKSEGCGLFRPHYGWIGVDLFFDSVDRVREIRINRIPDDADPLVRKVALAATFKGKTHELFYHYSNALRLELLGANFTEQVDDAKDPTSARSYSYPAYALEIDVSPNPHGPEWTSDLYFIFSAPK